MVTAAAVRGDVERASDEVERLRAALDVIDAGIVELIGRRCRTARGIGEAKRRCGQPATDLAREAAVVRRAASLAAAVGVEGEDLRAVFWRLIALSRRAQTEVGQ